MGVARKASIGIALSLTALALAPLVLYAVALSQVEGRPTPRTASHLAAESAWQACGERAAVEFAPLDPWQFTWRLASGSDAAALPGERAAWAVARQYNAGHLRRHIWWHPSGAALTIWLTRHWSAEQLASTVAAGNYCRPAPNNSSKPTPLRGAA